MLALELLILSHLPTVGLQLGGTQSTQAPLSLALNWQSAIVSGCLAILTTLLVVGASAVWISHLNVVAAIRDLDEPAAQRVTLFRSLRDLWTAPRDACDQVIPETPARRLARRMEAIGHLYTDAHDIPGQLPGIGPALRSVLGRRDHESSSRRASSTDRHVAGSGLLAPGRGRLVPPGDKLSHYIEPTRGFSFGVVVGLTGSQPVRAECAYSSQNH